MDEIKVTFSPTEVSEVDEQQEAQELLSPKVNPVSIPGLGQVMPYELGISTELEIYGLIKRLDAVEPTNEGFTLEQQEQRAAILSELQALIYPEYKSRSMGLFPTFEEFSRQFGKNAIVRLTGMLLSFGRDPNAYSATQ